MNIREINEGGGLEDATPSYDLLCRMKGARIGTTPADGDPISGRTIEVDLFLRTEGPIYDALRELLNRLERLMRIGFSISMEQEFSLTCSRYVEDIELEEVLEGAIAAIEKEGYK